MSKLPARPSLASLRKQAKSLLDGFREKHPEALATIQEHHPKYAARRSFTQSVGESRRRRPRSRETYLPSDQTATHPSPLKVVVILALSNPSQTSPASSSADMSARFFTRAFLCGVVAFG